MLSILLIDCLMVIKHITAVVIIAFSLAGLALPALGQSELQGFYDPSSKYRQWFNETKRYKGLTAEEIAKANRKRRAKTRSTARTRAAYPDYPDQKFKMTEELWKKASAAILKGGSEWQDTEIIRHAAENGAHGPAMDFLAWMYQEGRGLDKDFRKAYMWYERAKLAGVENLRGSSSKIYDRMSERDKYFADLQLAEDNKKSKGKAGDYKRIQMQVLGKDRDKEYTIKK
ncbi:MAG: SEL1-like repeat protein [Rhodospirillales bacterium]|nr:SEL1-like repeat protein [Rhodospirillales bacterium]